MNKSLATRKMSAPDYYKPSDFYRRELPWLAKRQGTQLERSDELQKESEAHFAAAMAAARAEWELNGEGAVQVAVQDIKARLLELQVESDKRANELKKLRVEMSKMQSERDELRKFKCTTMAARRQSVLKSFFSSPCEHQMRPHAPPTELGSGYTQTNVTSGILGRHVKAIELHILELSKGDPLKQLQLAAAVCQRMQGIYVSCEKKVKKLGRT